MKTSFELQNYKKKGFDDRVVKYEKIQKVTNQEYEVLLKAIDVHEGEIIFEGCAGYADVSEHIIESTKDFTKKPEIYIEDESLVQMNLAQKEISLPKDHMILGDIRTTGMEENKFDKTVIKMGIHELPKDEQSKVFKEMYRILKTDGKFIIWELSLNKDNQKIFQDIIRKKDELAGFEAMVKNRYFQRYDELVELFKNAGFNNIKDEYNIRYTFNPQNSCEDLVSKDRLQMINEKGSISNEDEQELNKRAKKRVSSLVQYMREIIPEDMKEKFEYKDLGDDIEITVNKIIMSGKK